MKHNVVCKKMIPYWDGKAESFWMYQRKIEAYSEFMGIENALNTDLLENCPTWLEFVAINIMIPTNRNLIPLYKVNKKICAIMVLGQAKSHGLALLSKTKCDNYPNGSAWELMSRAKKVNTPSDQAL